MPHPLRTGVFAGYPLEPVDGGGTVSRVAAVKCRNARRLLSRLCVGGGALALLIGLSGPSVAGASAPSTSTTATTVPSSSQISATQAQVSGIEATIEQEQEQSAALDQRYDAAEQQVQTVQNELTTTSAAIATTRVTVSKDRMALARDAVNAYIFDSPEAQAVAVFNTAATQADARSEYENQVIGNISSAENALQVQQAKLASTEQRQQSEEQQATTAAAQVQSLQQQNAQAQGAAQATLQQVQGALAQQVAAAAEAQAQAQAAAAAAAHTQAAAQAAAQAAQSAAGVAGAVGGAAAAATATTAANQAAAAASGSGSTSTSTTSTSTSTTSVAPSGGSSAAGNAAVAAAISQLGVPYEWGGETAGTGFDCSGLTQWSWAQAGVSIPRTAASQYASLSAVPLDALEPGDLLFYYNLDGDDEIDHVVMYVGSGPYGTQTIIQAPYTGSTVSYSPVFTVGLVGAARP